MGHKHTSGLFGPFEYDSRQVIDFPRGTEGFEQYTKYVLKRCQATEPFCWLLSVEEGGPDFALVKPERVNPRFRFSRNAIREGEMALLGDPAPDDLRIYAVASIPADGRDMSVDLRAPVLINPRAHLGVQSASECFAKKPVRYPVYESVTGRPPKKYHQLTLFLDLGASVSVGNDVLLTCMRTEKDGTTVLAVERPEDVRVARKESLFTPRRENLRARNGSDVKTVERILHPPQAPAPSTPAVAAQAPADPEKYVAG